MTWFLKKQLPLVMTRQQAGIAIRISLFIGISVLAIGSTWRLSLVVFLLLVATFLIRGVIAPVATRSSESDLYLNTFVSGLVCTFTLVIFISINSAASRVLVVILGLAAVFLVLGQYGKSSALNGPDASVRHGVWKNEEYLPFGFALCILALRGFVPITPFAFASLLMFIYIALVREHVRTQSTRMWLLIGFALVMPVSLMTSIKWANGQPFFFWLTHDQMYRTSLASGLSRWGYRDLNSAAGLTLNYHWLSEAFGGALSRLSGEDEFLVITRTLPLLAFVACFVAMWRLVRSAGCGSVASIFGTAVTCLVLLEVDPYSVGTLTGVAVMCRLFEYCGNHDLDYAPIQIQLLVLLIVLMMVQTPFGLIAATTMFIVVGKRLVCVPAHRFHYLRFLVALVSVPLVLRATLLRPSDGIETAGSLKLGNVLQHGGFNVPFGLESDSPGWLRSLNSGGYILETFVLIYPALLFAYHRLQVRDSGRQTTWIVIAGPLCLATLVISNLIDIGVAQGKLFSGLLVSLLPASLAFSFDAVVRRGIRWLLVVGVWSLLTVISYRIVRTLENDRLAAILSVLFVLGSAVGVGWSLSKSVSMHVSKKLGIRELILVGLSIVVGIGISVGRQDRVFGYLARASISDEVMVGSTNTRSCIDWIRHNTEPNVVIATDIFDPASLPGSEKSYLVSAFSKRRVWIDGLYNSRRYFEKEVERRVMMLDDPEMLPEKIRYFVLGSSNRRYSKPYVEMSLKVENDDCVVLERGRM